MGDRAAQGRNGSGRAGSCGVTTFLHFLANACGSCRRGVGRSGPCWPLWRINVVALFSNGACRRKAGRSGPCWPLWRDDVLAVSPNGAWGRAAEGWERVGRAGSFSATTFLHFLPTARAVVPQRDGVGRACCGVTTFVHFFPLAREVVRQRGGTEWAVLAPVAWRHFCIFYHWRAGSCRRGAGRSGPCWVVGRGDVLVFSAIGTRGDDGVGRVGSSTFSHLIPTPRGVVLRRGRTE